MKPRSERAYGEDFADQSRLLTLPRAETKATGYVIASAIAVFSIILVVLTIKFAK